MWCHLSVPVRLSDIISVSQTTWIFAAKFTLVYKTAMFKDVRDEYIWFILYCNHLDFFLPVLLQWLQMILKIFYFDIEDFWKATYALTLNCNVCIEETICPSSKPSLISILKAKLWFVLVFKSQFFSPTFEARGRLLYIQTYSDCEASNLIHVTQFFSSAWFMLLKPPLTSLVIEECPYILLLTSAHINNVFF